jgi:hypothetical protein
MTGGSPPAWGLGVGITTLRRTKIGVLGIVLESFGPGHILWINDLINGIWT